MGLERKLHKSKIEPQKIVVIFLGVFTGFALWAIFDRPLENQVKENLDQLEVDNSDSYLDDYPAYNFKTAKKILFYTPRYGLPDWNMGSGNEPFHSQVCRVENCYLTTNKSLLKDLSEFDALLFHMSGIRQDTIDNLHNMVIWVVKFQKKGYKIG